MNHPDENSSAPHSLPPGPWTTRLLINALCTLLALVLAMLSVFVFRPALLPSNLVGTYHCDYSHGIDTLTLNSDFTYTKTYAPNSGKPVVNKATWTMNADGQLVLFDAPDFDSGFNEPATKPSVGIWILSIRRDLIGRIFFTVNEDCDLEFRTK
jgi:hypothetical protein